MTIAAISSNPQQANGLDPSQPSGALQLLANNYNTLGQALQNGDLSSAQQAFTALIQGVPGGAPGASSPSTTSGTTGPASVGADLVSLGQALQSGNLPAAQQAFDSLQQAVQSVGKGHGGGGDGGGDAAGGAAASSSAGSSTTVTSQVSVPNADGTVTITITYADGSTQKITQPSPNAAAKSPLDPNNPGQLGVLLTAQEQSAP